jgi:hypothetical protein
VLARVFRSGSAEAMTFNQHRELWTKGTIMKIRICTAVIVLCFIAQSILFCRTGHAEVVKLWSSNGEIIPNPTVTSSTPVPQCSEATVAELRRLVAAHPLITVHDDVISIDAQGSSGRLIRKEADRIVVVPDGRGRRIIGFWDEGTSSFVASVSLVPTKDDATRPVRLNIIRRPEGKPTCTTQWVGSGEVQ